MFVLLSIFSFLAETTKPFEYYTLIVDRENVLNVTLSDPNVTKGVFFNSLEAQHNSTNSTNRSNFSSQFSNTTGELTTDTNNIDLPPIQEHTTKRIRTKAPSLQIIDLICLCYFAVEYITRFVFAPKKLKYITSLLAIIDLLAILPDVIEFTVYQARPELRADVRAVGYVTIIRIVRVLRIFRLVRHSAGLWILIYTLRASSNELLLLVWFMGLGILVFSSLIYYVDDKQVFHSIPTGFWWALITMTTVGYGDMYPTTVLGKFVGSLCAMAGVLMIGFTVPSLVNNFMLYYRHVQFAMYVDKTEKEVQRQSQAEQQVEKRLNGKVKDPSCKMETFKLMNEEETSKRIV